MLEMVKYAEYSFLKVPNPTTYTTEKTYLPNLIMLQYCGTIRSKQLIPNKRRSPSQLDATCPVKIPLGQKLVKSSVRMHHNKNHYGHKLERKLEV